MTALCAGVRACAWGMAMVLSVCLGACDGTPADRQAAGVAGLEVWVHAGQERERRVIQAQVARFNASQQGVRVRAVFLPEGSYNAQVQAAAFAGKLPDLLEFDGPFVYPYVWQGHLIPLDGLLAEGLRSDLLPSIIRQGTYRGRLYSVGAFDSGLGIYVRRSLLEEAGVRLPRSVDDAWTAAEFTRALAALAERDPDGAVLDLKLNHRGEWYTYAFAPVIQSAGGDLIDRQSYRSAAGVLNGEAAVGAMRTLQGWIGSGYVDPNLDDAAFVQGRVALSWAGHWEYRRYREAFGDDLGVVPLPDFGQGPRTGQGSWNWGVTTRCKDPRAAVRFLEFLLRPGEVLTITAANGAVPARRSAIGRSPLYREGGPLHLFAVQLERTAVPRPRTPAYPIITSAFQAAFEDIRNGGDVQRALDKAVAVIDQEILDNRGYPPVP